MYTIPIHISSFILRSSKKGDASEKILSSEAVDHHEDQYANLRYNPNFRKKQLEKEKTATGFAVDYLHDIPQ